MSLGTEHKLSEQTEQMLANGEIDRPRIESFRRLVDRIEGEILPHPVITNNKFAAWFAEGNFDREDARHFLVQFSVFSNLFIIAQLKKTINAPTLEAMRTSKEILLNELGVSFRNPSSKAPTKDDDDHVEKEGTIEGGTFRFRAAHFEWLLRMVSHLDLEFKDVGKRKHGTQSTLFFVDELSRLYGSDDPHVALGASFAVENWAAAGFWKQLIAGWQVFKKRECPALPISFFAWHDQVEDQHKQHTWDELEEDYFSMKLDEDKFIEGGKQMLDGVMAFWNGLDEDRLKRAQARNVRH